MGESHEVPLLFPHGDFVIAPAKSGHRLPTSGPSVVRVLVAQLSGVTIRILTSREVRISSRFFARPRRSPRMQFVNKRDVQRDAGVSYIRVGIVKPELALLADLSPAGCGDPGTYWDVL